MKVFTKTNVQEFDNHYDFPSLAENGNTKKSQVPSSSALQTNVKKVNNDNSKWNSEMTVIYTSEISRKKALEEEFPTLGQVVSSENKYERKEEKKPVSKLDSLAKMYGTAEPPLEKKDPAEGERNILKDLGGAPAIEIKKVTKKKKK